MILPLINTMTLKTGKPMKIAADVGAAVKPGTGRHRRSTARTGLMLVGLLTVAVTMLRMAKRRSR
ncbi:MAG: hypothetical protein JWO67_5673 [Streptosporangiaceae bacterium]|jgi:hypothetical protein|nr:hypothetical protein [Streptosporangiaceae bacterium]